jgi:CubicO group peptidase (beta-lactamase class C family)
VQRASGKPLRDFADENIFLPLERMTHTQYRNDHTSLIPHRALGYDRNEKGDYTLGVSYAEVTGDGSV